MNIGYKKKLIIGVGVVVFLFILWELYVPHSITSKPTIIYTVEKGSDYQDIGKALKDQSIIRSGWFFKLYAIVSGNYSRLQAGSYELSSSMSLVNIVRKIAAGDVVKNYITIIEGWNLKDIGAYFETKKISSKEDFLVQATQNFSGNFDFLKDKPKKLDLEGYIFPDTYEISVNATPEEILKNTLSNFNKKLNPELRKEITLQQKSIFEIITMASIIEKEVKSLEDKKIISGILWKRINNNIPLQVDATINYITGKNDSSVQIKDTKIDSPYNTYKYGGLPKGPISNPGMESILAAIYPENSPYWYYLSAKDGQTIFSKTLQEHNEAVAKYLK